MMDPSVVHALNELPDEPHVVTIGSFDGVHRGHQYLLERVVEKARDLNIASVAITFDPLPAEVLRPDKAPPRVCTTEERTSLMLERGLDHVVVLRFDSEMADQSADEFLSDLHTSANPAAIVVGNDFAFGHNRLGTPAFMQERAAQYGYELDVVERVNPEEDIEWSSSFIRRSLIEHGDVAVVSRAMGRYFRLRGIVGDGDRRGRKLGYPTANLLPPAGLVAPADGIYAAFVNIQNGRRPEQMPALVYVGARPTFGGSQLVIEVYVLDFDDELYGCSIAVDFVARIRGDRAFDSATELVEQMNRDEADGRELFARLGVTTPAHNE